MSSGTIWIDITELFDQFRVASHATGVSRTVANLADALVADPGGVFRAARPLFWHPILRCPLTTEDERLSPLTAFFPQLSTSYAAAGLAQTSYASRTMKAIATSLPRSLRYRLFPADNGVTLFARWAQRQGIGLAPAGFAAGDRPVRPGIVLARSIHPRLAARARAAGAPITAFVHDAPAVSHPNWPPGRRSDQVEPRLRNLSADVRRDRVQFAEHARRTLPPGACPRPSRSNLPPRRPALRGRAGGRAGSDFRFDRQALRAVRLDLDPRREHRLLVEAWHLLWRQLGPATPYLCSSAAAQPAPTSPGMMARQNEGGRILRLGSVDDASLKSLYRGAWMTAYPSLGEGYGLPVAEALGRGKVCLAAPSGGIREISPDLIDFIDPLTRVAPPTRWRHTWPTRRGSPRGRRRSGGAIGRPGGPRRRAVFAQRLSGRCGDRSMLVGVERRLLRGLFPGHRPEIMLGVLVVVLRRDDVAGGGFGTGESDTVRSFVSRCVRSSWGPRRSKPAWGGQ